LVDGAGGVGGDFDWIGGGAPSHDRSGQRGQAQGGGIVKCH
jgi:hypothetical protein